MTKLSIYATDFNNSKGRLFDEQSRPDVRTPFARDRDRILHSESFRRLKGKTQVFMSTNKDHHRTRLTHTLEVAQIARTIARTLNVDEDLTETIALAHDLGHPPYGHIGEDALLECMDSYGGFEHNEQSLRIVTKLEYRYPKFAGLNLTWESLEGILKHNGPITGEIPTYINQFNQKFNLEIETYASLEAQIAAIADDVAYNHHDIEDGIRAGLITIDDLYQVPHIGKTIDAVKSEYERLEDKVLLAEVLRRLMSKMVVDIVETTKSNIQKLNPSLSTDIRMAKGQTVVMGDDMYQQTKGVRKFLFENVYRSDEINEKRDICYKKVLKLFDYYMNNPEKMYIEDKHILSNLNVNDTNQKARWVKDYVAGMTDNFADMQYESIK